MEDNSKREQLLLGMQNLPLSLQIDKLKVRLIMIIIFLLKHFPRLYLTPMRSALLFFAPSPGSQNRIDMIGAACESAEKVIADTRKAYFGTRQGPTLLPTIDKVQAAKIQEQENLLRHAVNHGEGAILTLNCFP